MMNKSSLTSSPQARKTKRCEERDINSSGAAIKVRKYDCSSASTSMLTHQDEILSTELKLFDETWISNNLDLYHTYIPRKKEPLPEYNEERQRIAASAINQDEIRSKELELFEETWINKNLELYLPCNPRKQEVFAEDVERKKIAANLSRMRFQDDQSARSGVLKLYEDPWKIRKKLKKSDVGHMSRLLVATDLVNDHILKFLTKEEVSAIHSEEGLQFTVCDLDINARNGDNNIYTLKLKQWDSNGSFVFLNGWSRNFVKRRSLREGDEIGLYWDSYYRRFQFSVLNRAQYL